MYCRSVHIFMFWKPFHKSWIGWNPPCDLWMKMQCSLLWSALPTIDHFVYYFQQYQIKFIDNYYWVLHEIQLIGIKESGTLLFMLCNFIISLLLSKSTLWPHLLPCPLCKFLKHMHFNEIHASECVWCIITQSLWWCRYLVGNFHQVIT